jgi:hypothetical protein
MHATKHIKLIHEWNFYSLALVPDIWTVPRFQTIYIVGYYHCYYHCYIYLFVYVDFVKITGRSQPQDYKTYRVT